MDGGADEGEVVPPQYANQFHLPLRHSIVLHGHGGQRPEGSTRLEHYPSGGRKRTRGDSDEEDEDAGAAGPSGDAAGEPPAGKRRAYEDVSTTVGKVSGRTWKQPGTRASALGRTKPPPADDWARKMREKEAKVAWNSRKTAAKEAAGAIKRAERERREKLKARKEENVKKMMLSTAQKVTNAKKLQKMSKKDKSKLLKA